MADFTMYDREREFKWQIECQLTGGTNAYIDAEDIYSGRLTRQISSGEGIEVGSCYVSELDLTIVASALPSNVISVKPYFRLLTSTEIVEGVVRKYYTPYNLGVFKIASTKRKEYGRIDLVCYDKMADLDTLITPAAYTELLASDWKPFYLLDWIATKVNVTYTFTQSSIEAMPNGTLYFKLAEETSNIKTYRDLLQYVCMLIGAYGIFDEDGHLNIKTFADTTSYSLPASFRFSESFGDVPISYSGVELTVKNATTMFGNANNTVVRLSDNPFLYTLSNLNQTTDYATFIMQFLRNIYTEFQGLSYYAGEFEIPPDASLNVGRLLAVSGGGASDTINCFLQKIDINFDGRMMLSCGNPNTYVTRTQNRTTSSIANLTNRIETLESSGSGKEVYYGTTLPTVDIGQDSSLYYKIIQRPEDLKTLNVVEYIQSAQASYIPTDILLTSTTRIIMQGTFYRGYYEGRTAFGTEGRDLSDDVGNFVAITSSSSDISNCHFYFGSGNGSCEGIYETDVMLIADTTTRTFTISGNGTSHSVTVSSGSLYTPSSTPIGILCTNTSSEAGGFSTYMDYRKMNANAIIKRFQVYYNNILAYDLIPVQNANDVTDCGLYDRIHRKYYPGVNYNNEVPFTAGTATGEVINQLDECVEAGYLRVNDEWWEIYNGDTEYFAGNYIEITENNVITSTLKAGTNIQIADDGTISASGADVTQIITSGTELATINGTSIYAPTVTVTPITTTGTNIANIAVNGTTYNLFAPSGGGGGSGGSGYTADLLFENTDFSVASGTSNISLDYTLSASIDDYDAVIVSAFLVNKGTTREQVETIIINKSQYYTRAISSSTDDYNTRWTFKLNGTYQNVIRDLYFGFANNTTLKTLCRRSNSGEEPKLYRVYGLKFGGGSSGHNYSTTEQVVGTWIDGSTLYECTYDLGSDLTLQDSTWTDSGITVPTNANRCIKAEGIQSGGTSTCIMASIASTNITVQSTKNSGDSIRYLTIQYTKTS